jgi:NTE family protein
MARSKRLALVLAGGAARGAYEVGVVQHVVEEVARELGRPVLFDIICGTSVGALNACGLAAFADEGAGSVKRLLDVWASLDLEGLVRPDVRGVLGMGARLLGRSGPVEIPAREGGLLDPEGLERLIAAKIPFTRIADNLRDGHLEALTVSTTHVASGKTVVFVQRHEAGLPPWSNDPTIEPRAAAIELSHAMASAAVPILFRAVKIDGEFHCDGGLRQNVPLSPARRLGADGVLVVNPRFISTTPLDEDAEKADDAFPGPLFLLGKTLNALLLDRIDTDLARVESINRMLAAGTQVYGKEFTPRINAALGHSPKRGLRPMRTLLVRASEDIGKLAAEFVRSKEFGRTAGVTMRLLRRLADREARSESDLLSYVLFDGRFAAQLVELGRADAKKKHAELCEFVHAMMA